MKTHPWILIVLVVLGGAVPGLAQTRLVTPLDQVLAHEYVSPDRRFKIRFPDVPKEFDFPIRYRDWTDRVTQRYAYVYHHLLANLH